MVRLLIPFIIGILTYTIGLSALGLLVSSLILICLALSFHIYLKSHINRTLQLFASGLIYFCIYLLGILSVWVYTEINYANHFSNYLEKDSSFLVRISTEPIIKEKSIHFEGEILKVFGTNGIETANGKSIFYAERNQASEALQMQDLILTNAKINPIRGPTNPHQFDYKNFNQNKNIFYSCYANSNTWKLYSNTKTSSLFLIGNSLQKRFRAIFSRYLPDRGVRGMAEAIVFGYKGELEENIVDAFSQTGTVHVLAVSGLHVGIIYLLFAWILGIKKSKSWQLIVKTIIILVALFTYALITGFSPSVTRASVMFGLVLIGKSSGLSTNIYNTLATACFLLLMVNPLAIYSVGFQFSFLAVLGIVYFQKRIKVYLSSSNWLLDKIASLFSVSLAAQITTFPLSIYYFNQFPNLFFISNLIVIPLVTIILYLGIALLIFSCVPFVGTGVSKLLTVYIEFCVKTVQLIQSIPYSFTTHMPLSKPQMVFIYVAIISLIVASRTKFKYKWHLLAMGCSLFVVLDLFEFKDSEAELIFLHDKKEISLGILERNSLSIIGKSETLGSKKFLRYTIEPIIVNERLSNEYNLIPLTTLKQQMRQRHIVSLGNGFFQLNSQRFLSIDQLNKKITKPIKVDYLIIGNMRSNKFYSRSLNMVDFDSCFVPEYHQNVPMKFLEKENVYVLDQSHRTVSR